MSSSVSESLNYNINHNLKLGDGMIKNYNGKEVRFSFFFDKDGKSLKEVLENCYREKIRNEQLLTGGGINDLQSNKKDVIMQS